MKNSIVDDIKEFLIVLFFSVSLLVVSLMFVFSIVQNYVDVNSILGGNISGKRVYLFLPKENYNLVKKMGLEGSYEDNIKFIKSKYKVIEISNLKNIDTKIPLVLIDNYFLTDDEKYQLRNYLKNGGSLVLNFNIDKFFLKEISGLTKKRFVSINNKKIYTSLLSPIYTDIRKINSTDKIPIFYTHKNSLIYFKLQNNLEAFMWSGHYGKGDWFYCSLPFKVLTKLNVLNEILDFSYFRYKVIKYPYLDLKTAIIIEKKRDRKKIDLKAVVEDDYNLINSNDIYKDVLNKVKMSETLSRAYILKIHKYILGFYKNRDILEKLIQKLQRMDIPILQLQVVNEKMIVQENIKIKSSITAKNVLINIENNNPTDVKNFTFRVYSNIIKVNSDFLNIKTKIVNRTENYVDIQVEILPRFGYVNLFLVRKKRENTNQ